MITATHLTDLSIEERVRFVQQRLRLIIAAETDADQTGIEDGDLLVSMQEAAREALTALDAVADAPFVIAAWCPSDTAETIRERATRKGGAR